MCGWKVDDISPRLQGVLKGGGPAFTELPRRDRLTVILMQEVAWWNLSSLQVRDFPQLKP